MKELDLLQMQKLSFEILKEFVKFCDDNNLRYRLCGGTLLGAVRHKGFIPWDDDIDISMPRGDYDKLLSLVTSQSFSEHLSFVAFEKHNLNYPFAKLLDSRVLVNNDYIVDDGSDRLWIDILPVDGLPQNSALSICHVFIITFLRKCLMLSMAKFGKGKDRRKTVMKSFFIPIAKLFPPRFYCYLIDKLARVFSYQGCSDVAVVSWGLYGLNERVSKKDYETVEYLSFCGDELNAFQNWENYLINLYNDYMTPPPISKREAHSSKAFFLD